MVKLRKTEKGAKYENRVSAKEMQLRKLGSSAVAKKKKKKEKKKKRKSVGK